MKEYIDREALLQDIKETVVYTARPDRENLIGRGVQLVLDRIAAAPAADVAHVVRNKDCKHHQQDYIDREAAKQELLTWARSINHPERLMTEDAIHVLDTLPAADVAPVVRCKDCKHYQHYGKTSLLVDGKNIKAGWCQRRIRHDEEHRMLADDFCSYGERRD